MKPSRCRRLTATLTATALSLLAATSAAAAPPSAAAAVPPLAAGEAVPGEVIVRFAPAAPRARVAALDAVGATAGDPVRGLAGTRRLELPAGVPVETALARLREQPAVSWAEPDYVATLARVPDDPFLPLLWGLRNFGQTVAGAPGAAGVDIDAEPAWDVTVGSRSVRVAVVDSGIDGTHPDLTANLDRPLSRNFASESPVLEPNPARWEDPIGHGTHVAGTIGAAGDNGLGVTGVSWAPDLVAVRACGVAGTCTSSHLAEALAYAGRVGAKVANASLSIPKRSLAMEAAMEGNPGTLYVAAAGNKTIDVDLNPRYPCSSPLPNVVCVAALDNAGALPSYSNWGAASVDVGAPGSGVYSTVPNRETRFDGTGLAAWTSNPPNRWQYVEADDSIDFDPSSQPLPPETTLTTAEPVSLAGGRDCHLTQELALDTIPGEQMLQVEASTDGSAWSRVQPATPPYSGSTGGNFARLPLDLSAYDGQGSLYLRYRFLTTEAGREGDPLVSFRGFRVACVGAQPPAGVYGYMSGTSMAAPHVAGVAALAWSAHPGASVAAVRDAILGTAVPTPSLAGRTATGGRVDAAAALAALAEEGRAGRPAAIVPAAAPLAPPRAAWALAVPTGRRLAIDRAGRLTARLRCRGAGVASCRGRLVLVGRLSAAGRRSAARPGRRVVLAARSFAVPLGRAVARRLWLRPRAAARYRDGRVRRLRLLVRTRQPAGAARRLRTAARPLAGPRPVPRHRHGAHARRR